MPDVVKLGGSLLEHPQALQRWLRIVAGGGGRLVVVPGGGPFADAVRIAQRKSGIDDRTAHRMALLAMEQYGVLLASLAPVLAPAESVGAMREALQRGRVPVWMPFRMVVDAKDIEASWGVTSDSLAAWLAHELDASALWLVKSCAVAVQDPLQLAAMGVVDAAFPRFLAASGRVVQVLGPGDTDQLSAALASPEVRPRPAAAP